MKFSMVNAQELLVDDLEHLLREINDYSGALATTREAPKILENYLLYVAKTGNTVFPWQHVRTLFRSKLQSSIATFSEAPLPMEATVFERFDLFRAAPFTIQRLSELITEPKRHYKLKDKYLFALEKAVYVVSTVEPFSLDQAEVEANGTGDNNSVEDNEVSYHELNSTFNVTPNEVLTMPNVGEVATSFPTEDPSPDINPPPVVEFNPESNLELKNTPTPLEVSSTDELTVTASSELVQTEHRVGVESVLQTELIPAVSKKDEKESEVVNTEHQAPLVPVADVKVEVENNLQETNSEVEVTEAQVQVEETVKPVDTKPVQTEDDGATERFEDEDSIANSSVPVVADTERMKETDDVNKSDVVVIPKETLDNPSEPVVDAPTSSTDPATVEDEKMDFETSPSECV